ncbi:Similar to GPI anchored protein [Ajellomyces dermatitidis SLH14081]; acc. no. XP_002622069 [Pyronema omphalodes CBS 100304]|uniref:Similar to GPI anchored protein [Ajellomyces dermatitidis SLH14081] acc. no. XP_002622069 n=1 Tax=Pyronema omphalodes (strain CBS 100304) TaxID=1076935 RepID=U4L786_PYROM|nr:Similar to GPI anchored protein [Ajellomyces dermatitidis SLH14081]; acc. no. XP_002622069 [Pyronema omphalodes CBS 100304]
MHLLQSLFLFATAAAAITTDIEVLSAADSTPQPRVLKPISRLRARSSIPRSPPSFSPRDSVELSYSEDPLQSAHAAIGEPIYHASLTLHSHPGHKILVLESIEPFLVSNGITCDNTRVSIVFSSEADALAAESVWRDEVKNGMVVVTEHSYAGCKGQTKGDRGVFMAQSVSIDPESHPPTVKLTTVPLTWQQAASRMSVSLDHSPSSKLDQELRRRQASNGTQEENSKAEFKKLSLNSTGIPDRVQLYPFPVGDGASDTTGEPTTTPGANTAAAPAATNGVAKNAPGDVGKQSAVKTDIGVTCVGCGTSGSMLVKAAFDMNIDPLDLDNDDNRLITINAASLYMELDSDFKAIANLELYAGVSTSLSFVKSVFPFGRMMLTPFRLGGVLSIGPIFDFQVAMDIAGPKGSVNMTYGAELTVPKGARANLTYGAEMNHSYASGWDTTGVKEIPFNLTSLDGEFSLGVNLTARPSFTFGIQLLEGVLATIDAGFELDLPKLYAKATAVTTIKIASGLGFEMRAVSNLEAGSLDGKLPALIDQTFSYPLLSKEFPAKDLCFGFDKQNLGKIYNITEEKPTVDKVKVQALLDKGGELPSGVDPSLFPAKSKETGKKSGAANIRVGTWRMLMAVGVAFFLL